MPNRLFYTVKLNSELLKEYKNHYNATFEHCKKNGLIVSLSDSQMLKSIRDITNNHPDLIYLEELFTQRDRLKKKKNSPENRANIKRIQKEIDNMMYIPEYITVSMNSTDDYEDLYKNGLYFNNKLYVRMSCSASQARVSTIVFISQDIHDELKRRLDNGRDLFHPLSPSKYSAYLGLYSSASKRVTTPRYCIVPDYIEHQDIPVSWSIENPDWNVDDTIEDRTIDCEMNRFDGSGLISPNMAEQWAKDIELEYTPCNYCIRYAFTKGLVNEFDFVEWCRDENNGNYFITDIYGQQRDLREIDVILTEGMAKLWDSWVSQRSLDENATQNGIEWRVTKIAPDMDKEASTMNYQYLQTLNLSPSSIKNICKTTIDYIQGVSYQNIYYTLLFLCGQSFDEEHLKNFLQSSDNYWLKSLILNHNMLNDKYTKEKIRDMIIGKIEQACLGRIYVQGNYQPIIPDSYALMQHITGQPVTGLLDSDEFYSQFWENRNARAIACARSPQTWRAEWPVMKNKFYVEGVDVE